MTVFKVNKLNCSYVHNGDDHMFVSNFINILFTFHRVFGKFGYGFGLPKNSPYTHQFSVKILELRQKGFVKHLRQRWLQGVCEMPTLESGRPIPCAAVVYFPRAREAQGPEKKKKMGRERREEGK